MAHDRGGQNPRQDAEHPNELIDEVTHEKD
jgi:hypothetical protein